MSGQTVNQTVTVKVGGSSCCPEPPCPTSNYATQAELSAGLSSLSTAISEIVVNSSVTPANLSTLSTSIGQLSNSTSAGLSSLSTSIGRITGSTVTPANISTLSTPIGLLEYEVANIINYDIPALESGISSLSTAIANIPVNSNVPATANISTIQPAYSTLTMNISTLIFPTSTNVYGNVNFVNGVSLGGNLNFNNGIQLTQNNIPYFLFSTSQKELSSIYTSSFLIPVTQSLRSIDFILAGANGASYSNDNNQTKAGGLGAWIQGTLSIPSSFYGKTLEVTLPSSIGARYPTCIRLLETATDLIYAGNGGSAAFIDGVTSDYIQYFGEGGSAGSLTQNATAGTSISGIQSGGQVPVTSSFYIYVSSGTGAVGANGVGGGYADSILLSPPQAPQPSTEYQAGTYDSNGTNGLNHLGGLGGNYLFPTAHGGDGGGGYYAGGGGACVVTFCNLNDPYTDSVYYETELSAGGGGGSSYINPTYITYTNTGINNPLTMPSQLSNFTSTASVLFNFKTNLFTFYGSLDIVGPSGKNTYINSI